MRVWIAVSLLCQVLCFQNAGIASASEEGLGSLFNLCDLLGHEVASDVKLQVAQKYSSTPDTFSVANLKQAASDLGLSVLGIKATLDELDELNRPCIVHLQNPPGFLVLLDVVDDRVQVMRGEDVLALDKADYFASRFSGYAIVPDTPETPHARVLFEKPDVYLGVKYGSRGSASFSIQECGHT